jgi:hypothetical protein
MYAADHTDREPTATEARQNNKVRTSVCLVPGGLPIDILTAVTRRTTLLLKEACFLLQSLLFDLKNDGSTFF